MPREKRLKSKSGIYHVMCRALNKQMLFDEENDFVEYLNLLSKSKIKFNIKIFAYCLMTNHVHILLKDHNDALKDFMKSINTSYAKYYNKKYERVGYVFNDRFHSEPVENVKYFLTCLRYIHQNPVKALICKMTYDYKFTSIHAYRRMKGNYLNIVDTKFIDNKFDKQEFLRWTEIENHDKCMDVICNKMGDNEVAKILYSMMKVAGKKEYLKKTEQEKIYYILKLVDMFIPMRQIARVSGIYYNKIQKLSIAREGGAISLTYKR